MRDATRWRRLLGVLAVLALVASACGGDDGDDPGGATDTETDMESPTDGETAGGEITTDVGVTEEPCPEAVDPEKGCIYLGVLSDLTEGPFAALAVPITDAQEAFWNRVNENGGIGGQYEVNISEYTRDNRYNPEVHAQLYQEIKPNVLALAQTLGSPTTAAILEDMVADNMVGAPASWTSLWEETDVIVESGNNYCVEAMNSLDYYVENQGELSTVMAVHLPGDYGEDGAAGTQLWAEEHGVEFSAVEHAPGDVTGAVQSIVSQNPDLVFVTTTPTDLASIVGGAASQGYQGFFIGSSPTWNPALLDSPAGEAFQAMYWQGAPFPHWDADTPAHNAMREALGDVQGNDGYSVGWAWSYPLLAALQDAAENGDLTRQGLLDAVLALETVDYEGMLPPEAGTFAGDINAQTARVTIIGEPDPEAAAGVSSLLAEGEFYTGPTAEGYDFTDDCIAMAAG